jgi:hypothetical protein
MGEKSMFFLVFLHWPKLHFFYISSLWQPPSPVLLTRSSCPVPPFSFLSSFFLFYLLLLFLLLRLFFFFLLRNLLIASGVLLAVATAVGLYCIVWLQSICKIAKYDVHAPWAVPLSTICGTFGVLW